MEKDIKKQIPVAKKISEFYEKRDFNNAVRHIMHLADLANHYIDEKKPWGLVKQNPNDQNVQNICTMSLNLFRLLIIFLKPILPKLATNSEEFLQITPLTWDDRKTPLLNHKITEFKPLMQRVDTKNVELLLAP